MPLEIQLNVIPRTFYLAHSRQSIFIIEERRTGKTTGKCWTWHIAGAVARYRDWIIDQECCYPMVGEALYIETTDPDNNLIITTKIRILRKV